MVAQIFSLLPNKVIGVQYKYKSKTKYDVYEIFHKGNVNSYRFCFMFTA